MGLRGLPSLFNRWMFAVLGAAGLSLAVAVIGTFVARTNLLEAGTWVHHTSEVELAIADCRLHVRGAGVDPETRQSALGAAIQAAERVRRLTVDNPPQQARVADLLAQLGDFSGGPAAAIGIDALLRELSAVEASLMDVGSTTLARATHVGWLMLYVSASLTLLMVAVFVGMLLRQSETLVRAKAGLQQKSALLEAVLEGMGDGVMAATPDRQVLHYNRTARQLLGEQFPTAAFPRDWRALLECVREDGTPLLPEEGALARALGGRDTDRLVYQTRHLDAPADAGTWISATGRTVRAADGAVIAGVVVLHDISEQKRHQDQLHALSISDELTGLHNRRGFLVLAEQHARVAQRQQAPFGVVFADLNGLKTVNDTRGHEAGDKMIRAAAEVLREVFRGSDVVGRLGGDEFVALLPDADPAMQAIIVERVERGLARHNLTSKDAPQLSLSLGISFFDPKRPSSIADLMIDADRLMYADKRERKRQPA